MIQPSALPAAPALTPVATAPVATGEAGEIGQIDAGFAALLGLQLEATAGEEKQVAPLAALLTPQAAPAKVSADGKTLPEALPPIPAVENEEKPAQETADDSVIEAVLAALPLLQSAIPAVAPAPLQQRSTPPSAAPAPLTIKAAVTSEPSLPAPASPRAEGKAEPVAPTAAPLPQLTLTVPEETSRPAKAEPVRTIAAAPQAEVSATPAATFQPVVTAPQSMSAPAAAQPHARHDFAALVDRLVEARDTALTVQTPQSVAAAIRHSDFGDVSIRFEHRGDALAVSLSNADPDFTRAVQAATPAAQTNTAGDNSAQPQRHEGSGQQSATGSGTSQQSQPRQGSASNRSPIQQERDSEQQPTSGGIFA
jgi:hypothetical protein